MADLRKYGVETRVYFMLRGRGTPDFLAGVTIAAGDAKISKDGGAYANVVGETDDDLFVDEGGGLYSLKVAIAEVQCASAAIKVVDQTSPKEWEDLALKMETYGNASAQHEFDLDASIDSIVDLIWDEVLTGATHNIATSAARRLRELSAIAIRQETAQAGTDSTITLDVGASADDCIYDRNRVNIVEGTGTGQSRIIILYDGTTFVAVVDRPWAVIPDNTSVFQILAGSSETDCLDHGYAQAGATGSITLKLTSSAENDFYKDCEVMITAGAGAGQTRLITGYTGGNQIALVSSNWITTPNNTSIYHVKYAARKVACSLGETAKADVKTAVEADGSKLDHLWETTEDDAGVRRFTTNALEQATGIEGGATVANQRKILKTCKGRY